MCESDANLLPSAAGGKTESDDVSRLGNISYGRLIRARFMKNRLSVVGLGILIIVYALAAAASFVAPHDPHERFLDYISVPPQLPHFVDSEGRLHARPHVYGVTMTRDPYTLDRIWAIDYSRSYPIRFCVVGSSYQVLWATSQLHLFSAEGTQYFALGTDTQGRDFLSRILHGGRISATVGLIGVSISLVIGVTVGMASGYLGGLLDSAIQRIIEVILSFPTIPFWLALSGILPPDWSPLRVFFCITVILSFIGWGGLARVVRGMTLALREEEYVSAARMSGGGTGWIIRKHMLPANLSYIIVNATLAIPGMILGETALSFLGLGIRPPIISWGVLLKDAQSVTVIAKYPWLMLPVAFVAVVVLAFNFVGDGLRDAVDPHSRY